MIDIHSHFLFGVDDGPKTKKDALRIIEKAAQEGITNMIATPHAFNPHFHVSRNEIEEQIELLKDIVKAEKIPVTLHTGQEVRLCANLVEKLLGKEILTLAHSRYLLLELPTQSVPAYTVNIIQSLLAEGIIPIIAHPERNRAIAEKPERLERLIRHGALTQITAGSIAGHFGKNVQKLSLQLIEANLVHTYGSDVHNMTTRPLLFEKGLDHLEKKKYHDIADILLENNERILRDELLFLFEPKVPMYKKWWQFIW